MRSSTGVAPVFVMNLVLYHICLSYVGNLTATPLCGVRVAVETRELL